MRGLLGYRLPVRPGAHRPARTELCRRLLQVAGATCFCKWKNHNQLCVCGLVAPKVCVLTPVGQKSRRRIRALLLSGNCNKKVLRRAHQSTANPRYKEGLYGRVLAMSHFFGFMPLKPQAKCVERPCSGTENVMGSAMCVACKRAAWV